MQYHIQAVIFDMDGVIIDSIKEIEAFWKGWAKKENVMLNHEIIAKHIHGRTGNETIEELFYNSSPEIKEEIKISCGNFDKSMRPELIFGVHDFLSKLSLENIPIALVTSSPAERIKPLLEHHNLYNFFKEFITGEDVINGKPHPEPYLKAAAKLNIDSDKCFVFEDSDSGIKSGLAADMYVISIKNNYPKENKLIANIQNFYELDVKNKEIKIHSTTHNVIKII